MTPRRKPPLVIGLEVLISVRREREQASTAPLAAMDADEADGAPTRCSRRSMMRTRGR